MAARGSMFSQRITALAKPMAVGTTSVAPNSAISR
jgi:hypothetical protein